MILLDTHVLLWLGAEPKKLSRAAASAIRRSLRSGGIGIASISLWEIAMLLESGRLRAPGTSEHAIGLLLEKTGVAVLEITPEVAALAVQFPESFPRDPADRLIAATARARSLPLVTADERIRESPLVKTIW
ncbi:MAG TPA: type II toxin-antitoxin system VapC family toxin [Thermoanaerobaculia bacterium]|nr:type II toxin-antitoxin system VapC family toxin [Thermoanaerobaculia bacterium]HQR66054.1 type II toxin-antitoxin system VapC family toxin [Thermoanaerobaculia bacterium]